MRKLKLLLAVCALVLGWSSAWGQASYNHTYTEGVTAAAGGDYFLYNIGAKQFLTSGLNYGTRATVDNSGRVLTLTTNGVGYSIYTNFVSLNNRAEDKRKAGYLTTNGYVDTGSSDAAWVFTPVDVAGYTNAYTIKNSDTQYLFFDVDNTDPGCPVNVGSNTGNNYSYWLLIPRSSREAAGDYTHYLINTQMNACWEYKTWGGSMVWDDNAIVTPGGKVSNRCGEKYHTVVDIYQEIAQTLPNGKYRLSAQGFYRQDDGKTQDAPVLYINNTTSGIGVKTGTENSMNDASDAFTTGKYADNSVEAVVTDGSLRVGINITGANQWVIFDNFVLDLVDPYLSVIATDIPAATATALNANKWYKFIAASTDNYTFATTTIGNIVYTSTDYLLSEATGSAATATLPLTEGTTYYIKSTTAQTLTITPQTFTYTVGVGTPSVADGKYTQNKTFTLTFADYATDDPDGTFQILDASKITVNTVAATASITGNALTITLADALTTSTDYAISIAAGAVGYKADAANTAIALTVHTPSVFDGHYYIKKDGADLFFSRGGSENKQTVLDEFGVPVKITTDESNVSRVKFVDTGLLLGASGSSNMYWTDKGDGTTSTVNWTIAKSGDKFKFYLMGMADEKKGMNIDGSAPKSDTEANACDWELELPAAHKVKMQAIKDAQAAAVATAMGITGVSTQAQMAAKLAADYGTTNIAITGTGGTNKEAWQQTAPITDPFEKVIFDEETVNGLAPGLYRLRVYGFERIAGGQAVYDAGGAAGLAYVYATSNSVTEKVKLASLFDVQSDTQWQSGNDLQFGGKYYPNGQEGAQNAFNAGNYANDVYVQVVDEGEGTGSIKFGIKQPNAYYSGDAVHNNSQWICYNNFSLTLFEAKPTADEKTALAEAITAAEAKTLGFENNEYAPYNNVDALTKLATAKAIDPNTASGATVVAATTALNGATWTKNTAEVNAILWKTDYTAEDKASDNFIHPLGWTNTGYNTRAMNTAVSSDACLSTIGTAIMMKYNTTYGEKVGYTMPLKAGKIYKITFRYCGWGNNPTTNIVLTDPESNNITLAPGFKPATNDGNSNAEHWYDYTGYFVSTTAGNYVLAFNKVDGGQQQIGLTNVQLVSATELPFADGSVPTYAPGTYPTVKISRTLTAGRWATAVYPFAVSGVDNIAVIDSYDKTTGALGFTSATTTTANVPFLMRSTAGITELSLNDVAVATVNATDATANEASLKGVYTSTNITNTAKNFVLSNNMIYAVGDAGATIKPYRAYIQIEQDATPARLTFTIDGNETTGIDFTPVLSKDKGTIFNLQGQEVKTVKKGLYIQNGKKIVIK